MTTLVPEPEAASTDHGDGMAHAACPCWPDIALCGVDVSGLPWADDDAELANPCVVCLDLDEQPCPRCGR